MSKREGVQSVQLKLDHRAPVYVQVIQYFKEQIASGALAMGEEIPSRRELAQKLNINPNTVQRAYKEMEEEGLIFTEGNMPSRVTTDEKIVQNIRENILTEAVETFIQSVHTLQVPLDDVVSLVKEHYEKHNEDGRE